MSIPTVKNMAEMKNLQNEVETVEKFMVGLVREANNLTETRKTRVLNRKEYNRLSEVEELIKSKNEWLKKAAQAIRGFYKPAAA